MRVAAEPTVSVLTLARGRRGHLVNLIAGLNGQTVRPAELVIAYMQPLPEPDLPATGFPVRYVLVGGEEMPLAAARNRAAAAAVGDELVFLDVDCIPAPTLVARYRATAGAPGGVRLGEVAYLPPMGTGPVDPATLDGLGTRHPAKPALTADECRPTLDHGELWGLSFALSAADWRAAGGMDEAYVGYGGEETDFAARLERAGIGMWWVGGARAYHQHHSVHIPPLQHFAAIVRNARLFHARWGRWCMDYWLGQFARAGWIDWTDAAITILRYPSPTEIAAARQPDSVLFS